MTRPPHIVKNDDGYGRGSGRGYGSGNGYGSGYRSGRGNDNGYGSVDGYGSGGTVRWLDTSHPHVTIGWHKLTGGATPYKALP